WATRREIRRAGLFADHGVILGQVPGHYLRHDGEAHILLVGGTRSGKGGSTMIPSLLTWQESALINDPKDGEAYDVTAGWRAHPAGGNNLVYALTPLRSPHCRIDVLKSIRLGTEHEFGDAYLVAQSHVAPEKMARETSTSLHFRELAAMVLTAAE